MAQVVFSTWGGSVVDNRNVSGEPAAASFRLPVAFDGQQPLRAFMGWDGIIVFDKDVDIPAMAAEYMQRVQTLYCCGKCTPGKKGTKVLADLLQKVVKGEAPVGSLDQVADLHELLQNCKCTLCPSSTKPVLDAVTHYRADFEALCDGSRRPKNEKYLHKITAPCMDRCPAHIDIPKYVEEIKNYQYTEALATIRENMPMPSVCGRVCPHPCEFACRRENVDSAINIMVLKRTASDYEWMHKLQHPPNTAVMKNKTVGIVGAGPAGLACAYHLARRGIKSTIFEALPKAGGALAVGVPSYRLPAEVCPPGVPVPSASGSRGEEQQPTPADKAGAGAKTNGADKKPAIPPEEEVPGPVDETKEQPNAPSAGRPANSTATASSLNPAQGARRVVRRR